jgi:hypothetical protein
MEQESGVRLCVAPNAEAYPGPDDGSLALPSAAGCGYLVENAADSLGPPPSESPWVWHTRLKQQAAWHGFSRGHQYSITCVQAVERPR